MTSRLFRREIGWDVWREALGVVPPSIGGEPIDPPEGEYNIAPGSFAPIFRISSPGFYGDDYAPHGAVMVCPAWWGFVPNWWKPRPGEPPYSRFTAPAAEIAESNTFAGAFRHGRCIAPASGWYQWSDGVPFAIAPGNAPFACLAGLWSRVLLEGSEVDTFAIVTVEANDLAAGLGAETMPVVLDPADARRWLDPSTHTPEKLLKPCPAAALRAWPADPSVGNVRNQGPHLLGE